MNIDSNNPESEARDRFILSKGHAGVALYSVLADLGFFSNAELNKLNQGSLFGEHPHFKVPGIEVVSGSLGHGLPIATGMAMSDKLDQKDRRTVVLMGDGECYEGSVWEAANFAANHKLYNLWAIIDRNGLIVSGRTEEINQLEPFDDKWSSFGWEVVNIDAHDIAELVKLFNRLQTRKVVRPVAVIASSVKGKGVSFMENQARWHHGGINDKNYEKARTELMKIQNEYGDI